MYYPIVIHKSPDSIYGVTVPDLPGCFSAGETIEEAIEQAGEAVRSHIDMLLADGVGIPAIQDIGIHWANPDYADGLFARVSVLDQDDIDRLIDRDAEGLARLRSDVTRLTTLVETLATQHREAIARIDMNLTEIRISRLEQQIDADRQKLKESNNTLESINAIVERLDAILARLNARNFPPNNG